MSDADALRLLRERHRAAWKRLADDPGEMNNVALDALALAAKLEEERDEQARLLRGELDHDEVMAVLFSDRGGFAQALQVKLPEVRAAITKLKTEKTELQARLAQVEGENRRLLDSASMMYTRRLESQLAAMGRVVEAARKALTCFGHNPPGPVAQELTDALAALHETERKAQP